MPRRARHWISNETEGVDPKTVSSWMGHSDQKMIMQVYDHVTNEREKKAVEKLNDIFKTV